jgi:hypothetical protein
LGSVKDVEPKPIEFPGDIAALSHTIGQRPICG